METLNSMLYLLSYNSEVTTHALGVLSSYSFEHVQHMLSSQATYNHSMHHSNAPNQSMPLSGFICGIAWKGRVSRAYTSNTPNISAMTSQ